MSSVFIPLPVRHELRGKATTRRLGLQSFEEAAQDKLAHAHVKWQLLHVTLHFLLLANCAQPGRDGKALCPHAGSGTVQPPRPFPALPSAVTWRRQLLWTVHEGCQEEHAFRHFQQKQSAASSESHSCLQQTSQNPVEKLSQHPNVTPATGMPRLQPRLQHEHKQCLRDWLTVMDSVTNGTTNPALELQ